MSVTREADDLIFTSPTKGPMNFDQMFIDIVGYMQANPHDNHRLIIGTDSQHGDETCFVTAIIVRREGKGARYFYTRERERIGGSLRQRIFYEAARSLGVASRLAESLAENGYADLNVEIHLDIGEQGPTRALIREVVGMVVGSGFDVRIKPDSYGASKVADRHTK